MAEQISRAGRVILVLLGKVPVIGPCFKRKEEAWGGARLLLDKIDRLIQETRPCPCQITFRRQVDGRYTLVIKSAMAAADVLADVDELLLKRFKKFFCRLFILSCFYEEDENLKCLAVTEGLGAVLYSFYDRGYFQTR